MSKVALSGNASGTGTFTIASPNSNTDRVLSLPDAAGTVAVTGGQPSFVSTIGVGNATPSASGAGITFPATQSASSDANTLDDYEEGTFTPTWNGGSLSVTYCAYRKIGSFVYALYDITLGSSASGTTSAITLPFPVNPSVFYTGVFNYNDASITQTVNIDGGVVGFRAALNSSSVSCSTMSTRRIVFSVTYLA